MLTLDSKFAEYFNLIKGIACEDAVSPQSKIESGKTIGEVFAGYRDDPKFDEGWGVWALETMGKEFGSDIRLMIINKIKKPENALHLVRECEFLSAEEVTLLKKKFEGKMPTAEKEIKTGVVTLACDRVKK